MNSVSLALLGVITIHLLVAANIAYSVRLAYSHALNANGGGYPILGHAGHNFLALWLALLMIPKRDEYRWIGQLIMVAIVIVPAVQWWLIGRMDRLGQHRRAKTDARKLDTL